MTTPTLGALKKQSDIQLTGEQKNWIDNAACLHKQLTRTGVTNALVAEKRAAVVSSTYSAKFYQFSRKTRSFIITVFSGK